MRTLQLPIFLLALLLAGLWNLGGPPPWWDEGWTLSVARNVVEQGVYGRLLDGQPVVAGLSASPLVVLPVAGMFDLLGVGIWQGRVFGVICAVAALGVMFGLVQRLYDTRIAWGTLICLVLLSVHPQTNLFLQGREVLGEAPMLVLLIGGYLCMALAQQRAVWWIPAVLLWALAIQIKTQTLPFWLVSLVVTTLAALVLRRWRTALLFGTALPAAYLLAPQLGILIWNVFVGTRAAPGGGGVTGLLAVTALVTEGFNRAYALRLFLLTSIPIAAGLVLVLWRMVRTLRPNAPDADVQLLRLSLLAFAGSWIGWYLLLSVGVPRYLFPGWVMAAPFMAVLLHDLSNGYRLTSVLQEMILGLRKRRFTRATLGAWAVCLMVVMSLSLTLMSFNRYYLQETDRSAEQVAALLNALPPDARIETYESEIHFLLNRPYHFPPDQTHVELNKRSLLGQEITVDYDPLQANPDYLVVGRFAGENKLYEPWIKRGDFRLIETIGLYRVYERVRK